MTEEYFKIFWRKFELAILKSKFFHVPRIKKKSMQKIRLKSLHSQAYFSENEFFQRNSLHYERKNV